MKKIKTKPLKNTDFLSELPFYEELNVIKTDNVFKGYALSQKVERVKKKKDLLIQLEASKSSITDLLNDLLEETKGFKYQITLKVEFKKCKSRETEFASVYFNPTTKTVINQKLDLNKSFQEILLRIDNWINKGSGWIVETIKYQYINISTYRSSYVKLTTKLRIPKKD